MAIINAICLKKRLGLISRYYKYSSYIIFILIESGRHGINFLYFLKPYIIIAVLRLYKAVSLAILSGSYSIIVSKYIV
jgi:uncharacterized membrane protein